MTPIKKTEGPSSARSAGTRAPTLRRDLNTTAERLSALLCGSSSPLDCLRIEMSDADAGTQPLRPEVMDARWQRDSRLLVELWYLMKTAGERG